MVRGRVCSGRVWFLELGADADPGWWKSVTDLDRFDEDHMYIVSARRYLINASDDEITLRSRSLGDAARRQELACDYICTGGNV
jgi:hypothetical protein